MKSTQRPSGRQPLGSNRQPEAPRQPDDDAAKAVSAFLSDSRVIAERAQRCKNSGCAFLCTGLTASYCCRMCARSPGAHGPKCAKKLLPCSTPGCNNAVTGICDAYCCKMCARGKEHGPNCWCLKIELITAEGAGEEAEEEAPVEEIAAAASAVGYCEPCDFKHPDEELSEEAEVSDEELERLQSEVDANKGSIATNAAIIQSLREALNGRGG